MQQQLELYERFLPYCPPQSLYKIMRHMIELKDKIEAINNMPVEKAMQQVITYHDLKEQNES
jgi:hypothetical protein